jgi:hypothetical protein
VLTISAYSLHFDKTAATADSLLSDVNNGLIGQKNIQKIDEEQPHAIVEAQPSITEDSVCIDPKYCTFVINDNTETAIRFYMGDSKGLSLAEACGPVSNAVAESDMNPAAIEGGGTADDNYSPTPDKGFGIYQLTGDRQKRYVNYAKSQGRPVTDLETQLAWSWIEMENDYPDMLQKLKNIDKGLTAEGVSGPMEAAIIFHGNTAKIRSNPIIASVNPSRGYESSGDSARQVIKNRGVVAEDIYYAWKCNNNFD